mmetsp:Transcript_12291/g.30161  ORF Transcript_12291/g.30161 Transcript_12291/m.30161 type:complete len:248 (+) Transcript_12291:730-1473(+)
MHEVVEALGDHALLHFGEHQSAVVVLEHGVDGHEAEQVPVAEDLIGVDDARRELVVVVLPRRCDEVARHRLEARDVLECAERELPQLHAARQAHLARVDRRHGHAVVQLAVLELVLHLELVLLHGHQVLAVVELLDACEQVRASLRRQRRTATRSTTTTATTTATSTGRRLLALLLFLGSTLTGQLLLQQRFMSSCLRVSSGPRRWRRRRRAANARTTTRLGSTHAQHGAGGVEAVEVRLWAPQRAA